MLGVSKMPWCLRNTSLMNIINALISPPVVYSVSTNVETVDIMKPSLVGASRWHHIFRNKANNISVYR